MSTSLSGDLYSTVDERTPLHEQDDDEGDGGHHGFHYDGQNALEEQGGGLELSRALTFLDGVGVVIGIMVGAGRVALQYQ